MFVKTELHSQENKEDYDLEKLEQTANRHEWTPTLLTANSSALSNMVMYNGRVFSWTNRGSQNGITVIDGIAWNSTLKKWSPSDLYAGLQSELHNNGLAVNGTFSEFGYLQNSSIHYVTTAVPEGKKSFLVASGFSNSIYTNQFRLHYNSGVVYNNWRSSSGLVIQQSPSGFIANGYKKSIGLVISLEKQFSANEKIGVTLIWNVGDQSKAATTVNETYSLSGQRTYNPNWGWRHQALYFPNTKQTNAPLFNFRYQKEWNENTFIKISNALVIGRQSQSSLEWTKSADPRPDYYRYLPSYISDSAMRNKLIDWYTQHPEQLQINFDRLEKTNQSSVDNRSFYIVNQQNSDLLILHGAVIFSHTIRSNLNFRAGLDYAFDRIHYTSTIKDLLGGKYYYNYNSWINDDGTETSFQNDILQPDRKIKAGEQWGDNYTIRAIQARPWIQINKTGPFLEAGFAMGYGVQGLQRIGYNANGLFPNSSKGESNLLLYPSWDMKGQLLFKLSGRAYFRSILHAQWIVPLPASIYINQEVNAIANPYLLTEFHEGADIGFYYRAPAFKATISAFWISILNKTEQKMFYHDGYAAFVYGLVGRLNTINNGIESAIETDLWERIQLSVVSTYEMNLFSNNPQYQLLLVNNLNNIESGQLHLKNLPISNSPVLVNAIAIQYPFMYNLRLGCTLVYAQQRQVSIDFFRRSDAVKNRIDAYSWNSLVSPILLPDKTVVNVFISKTFQFKNANKQYRWTTSLSIRNALDAFIPIIAYEQSRFDYVHFNSNKYAVKYLLDQGVAYALHLQLQIQ